MWRTRNEPSPTPAARPHAAGNTGDNLHRAYSQARKQLGYGEYTIVVVTDGIANDTRLLANRVRRILDVSPINIYTIGFCIGTDHSLNQAGRTTYKAANNPQELRQGLQEVLAEAEHFDITDFSD